MAVPVGSLPYGFGSNAPVSSELCSCPLRTPGMRTVMAGVLAVGPGLDAASAAELTAEEIMARVAANQERSESLRSAMVYEQDVRVRLIDGRKLAREERHQYTITPTPTGSEKTLARFEGTLRHKGEMLPYAEPHYERTAVDLDAIFAEVLLEFVSDEHDSRDGIDSHFFPLTAAEQRKYTFRLIGEEEIDGHDAYRISYEPLKKGVPKDDRGHWKGEVFIDREQFQPVYLTTDLAMKVPLAIRVAFGTNVRQVGFALRYEEVEDGLWFPVSYGGEFRIRALFFYTRTATISMVNCPAPAGTGGSVPPLR